MIANETFNSRGIWDHGDDLCRDARINPWNINGKKLVMVTKMISHFWRVDLEYIAAIVMIKLKGKSLSQVRFTCVNMILNPNQP